MPRIRPELRDRITQYARTEPSFTAPFAAWELGCSVGTVKSVVARLLNESKVIEIEPAAGPNAATYRWLTRKERNRVAVKLSAQTLNTPASELKDREVAYVTQATKEHA